MHEEMVSESLRATITSAVQTEINDFYSLSGVN